MNFKDWYNNNFESRLAGRYVTLEHIDPILKSCPKSIGVSSVGTSEEGRRIPMLKIGSGSKIVLAWSQMHGNESTTTKACFDFLKFISQKEHFKEETEAFLNSFTLFIIPILNPDGAARYTRENSNMVDLNRDAAKRSQKESKALRKIFDTIKPDLCLNLHDQRTIYGLPSGLPATVSFLAPAADRDRSITPAREVAMNHIVRMYHALTREIPGQIGRYDDSFNNNCVGDTFQMLGVPTILFEAGHFPDDYQREHTRMYIFLALLELFSISQQSNRPAVTADYFKIPQNIVNFKDIIISNALWGDRDTTCSLAIQYREVLKRGKIHFIPELSEVGSLAGKNAHQHIDAQNKRILVNSQGNIEIGEEITTIFEKNDKNNVIYSNNVVLSS
jgi:hypothetical protein